MTKHVLVFTLDDKIEWITVHTLYNDADESFVIAASMKEALNQTVSKKTKTYIYSDGKVEYLQLKNEDKNELLQWVMQQLISYTFENSCCNWNYGVYGKKLVIPILGHKALLRRFIMHFLLYNSATYEDLPKNCVKSTCNNDLCWNPSHLRFVQHPRQKILEPDLVLEYAEKYPNVSQVELARMFSCSESAISRLLNKKSFSDILAAD